LILARDYPNIEAFGFDRAIVLQALLLCRSSGRTSSADAMTWAAARSADSEVVYSLDYRFPAEGLDARRGPEMSRLLSDPYAAVGRQRGC